MGPGGYIEHADDAPGAVGVVFQPGIENNRTAAGAKRGKNSIGLDFVKIGQGEETG